MKKILFTLVLGTWSLCTFGATYYASPAGTGNGSSYSSPTTFANGVSLLGNAGDTLYLLGGTYEFSDKFSINKQGSASKRIVISGFPGEQVTLDFHKVPYGTRGITVHANSQYVHIKDLAIAWSGKNNLYNEGSYCLFENLDIYGSADSGCQMKNGGNNTILNCDSHDNFDYELDKSGNLTQCDFGGNADGFADKQHSGSPNHYIGCRAWNNSDDGWDFFQRVTTSETIIEQCICYMNGPAYYDMRNHPRYQTDKAWFDQFATPRTVVDADGNTVTVSLERYPNMGNGNGFKVGGGYTDHKVLVHHSLAVANTVKGFDQNNNDGTMRFYNNTGYLNGVNFGFTTAYGTNYMRNNISLSGKNADQPKSQNNAANDHNTWNSGYSCSAADFQSLDTTQILASRQADHSLPEGTCLRLKATSALIDKGVDVNLTYNGDAPDLGCYEAPGEEHRPDTIPEDTVPTVQPEGTHAVAFVTLPGSEEDKALLRYLRRNDSLWIVETEATDATTDYSAYEVIVLGSKPNSGAAGFTPLKNYDKPMVLLKPFLLKAGVWGWGTAVNTQDLSVSITAPEHPLFEGLTVTDGEIQLFSQCNTNAVTAISAWNITGVETLASPVSQPTCSSIAVLPAGTNCNGTILPQGIIMIGVSEYSTAHLTTDGMRLIENAIFLQLGIDNNRPTGLDKNDKQHTTNHKYIQNGQLFIRMGEAVYDLTGRRISR